MTSSAPHGTYARYQQERKAGIEPCDDCRGACTSYMASWRLANPGNREREVGRSRARSRALSRLAKRHPGEFFDLFEQELGAIEIDPSPTS